MQRDYSSVWDRCLNTIRKNVNEQSFKTWFEPIKPVKISNKVLTIQVPSQFFYEWLEEHFVQILQKSLKKVIGGNANLHKSQETFIMNRHKAFKLRFVGHTYSNDISLSKRIRNLDG